MAKSLREDSYANVSFSGLHISYWDLAKLIDRRRSAPRQLEDEKKLESGREGACQIRAGQVGAGQFRAGQVNAVRQLNPAQLSLDGIHRLLCAIPSALSPVKRLPIPDVAFSGACFDASTVCSAE
jgi:hypothetical protein